jgi:O-antigen/teichoic acid export membrane protein
VVERVQRLVTVARKLPLPPGTVAVAAGIIVNAVTSYVFLLLAYRQLTTEHSTAGYGAVFGLWVVVFTLTPGFFQPLEQEVGRAVAHRRAQGIGAAPLVKRAAAIGGLLALFAIAVCVAAVAPITSRVFHDNVALFIALLIGIAVYYASYVARGALSGNGRFGAYGMILGAEGIVRLVVTIVLVVVGCTTPGPYGFAIAVPGAIALVISLRGQKNLLVPGPPAPYSELSTALGWLLLGSLLTQALSNSAYLAAISLATPGDDTRVGKFAAGILIARTPILAFGAVQAALLPRLASLAGAGREQEFRNALRRLVMIVLVVAVFGAVAGFSVGHPLGRLLFGSSFTLGNRDLGLLAVGSGSFILAVTLAQALIALRSYAAAALSWLAGVVGVVVAVALGNDLLLRAELGFVVGALASAAAMLPCLVVRLRSRVPIDALERLVDNIQHEPMEI